MPKILEQTLLEYTSGTSNKFYEVTLKETKNGPEHLYEVETRWGKRSMPYWKSSGGSYRVKEQNNHVSRAYTVYEQTVNSKKQKGYIEVIKPKTLKEIIIEKKKEKTMDEISLERFSMLEF